MANLSDYIGSADEAALLLDTDDLAESADYTPQEGGAADPVKGIYNAPFTPMNAKGQNVEGYGTVFICLLADLRETIIGGTILIRSILYNINGKSDSDDGFYTTLILSKDN